MDLRAVLPAIICKPMEILEPAMSVECCLHQSVISRYLSSQLDESLAIEFETHLLTCDICVAAVRQNLEASPQPEWLTLVREYKMPAGGINTPALARFNTSASAGRDAALFSPDEDEHTAVDRGSRFQQPPRTTVRYSWSHQIGAGGMGVVWAGRDHLMQRDVALKRLSPQFRDFTGVQRLLQEATALARLAHPQIVSVYEVITEQRHPALVMELVDGMNLAQWQQGKPVAPQLAAEICLVVAQALHHAHGHGIIHRDIKPSNVLLATHDPETLPRGDSGELQIKLSDFGLARVGEAPMLTLSGQTPGTPCYMAPEQITSESPIDARADVYGTGVLLYELLTGRPPYIARDSASVLTMIHAQDPISPRRLQPQVSRDLETICLKCLSRLPADRYPTAQDLAADLQALRQELPIKARPLSPVLWAVRWSLRNRGLAALLLITATTLISALIVAVIVAENQRVLRVRSESAERTAVLASKLEKESRLRAEVAEKEALLQAELEMQLRKQQQELLLKTLALADFDSRTAVGSPATLTDDRTAREAEISNLAGDLLNKYMQQTDSSQPLSWLDLEFAIQYLTFKHFVSDRTERSDLFVRIDDAMALHEQHPEDPLKFVEFRGVREQFFSLQTRTADDVTKNNFDQWVRLAGLFHAQAAGVSANEPRVDRLMQARRAALRRAASTCRLLTDPQQATERLVTLAAAAQEPLPHSLPATDDEVLVRIAALTQLSEIQVGQGRIAEAVEHAKSALDELSGLSEASSTTTERNDLGVRLRQVLEKQPEEALIGVPPE